MFQNSFLIIKSDYLHRRKPLLIHLLRRGFQIQANRRLQFSPELAAEFYQDDADEPNFMMQVILLSKGVSEAFILSKDNAAEDLINTMVCYFGTSTEMYRNIHVTRCSEKVQSEITYVFPNYIHEPIYYPDQMNFCSKNPIIKPVLDELYNIIKNSEIDQHKSWKAKLIEFLEYSNRELPRVSNQCTRNISAHVMEQGQQTMRSSFRQRGVRRQTATVGSASGSIRSLDFSCNTNSSSLNISSSSCLSCSPFGSQDECIRQVYAKPPIVDLIKSKTAPLIMKSTSTSSEEKKKDKIDKAVGPQFSFLYDWLEYIEEESYGDLDKDSPIALESSKRNAEKMEAEVVSVAEVAREPSLDMKDQKSDAVAIESATEIAEVDEVVEVDEVAEVAEVAKVAEVARFEEEIATKEDFPDEGVNQDINEQPAESVMPDDPVNEAPDSQPPVVEPNNENEVKYNEAEAKPPAPEVRIQPDESSEIKVQSQALEGQEIADTVEETNEAAEGE